MTTAARKSEFSQDARSAAELYLVKGLAPIPLHLRSKQPDSAGFQCLRLTQALAISPRKLWARTADDLPDLVTLGYLEGHGLTREDVEEHCPGATVYGPADAPYWHRDEVAPLLIEGDE